MTPAQTPGQPVGGTPMMGRESAIPYRQDTAVSMPEVGGLLLTAVLLLAAFYGVAWYARRAGWLDRWTGARGPTGDTQRKLAVIERMAVSRKTVLYRVRDGEKEFLLVESSASIHVAAPVERP